MKKAKNAFAIIGIILAVVAAVVLVLHPVIEDLVAGMSENGIKPGIEFGDYLEGLKESAKEFFNYDWIENFDAELLKVYYPVIIFAVGDVLFVVLFILMLCKKHAKGLGWWFPMAILFELSTVVAFVYIFPVNLIDLFIDFGVFNYPVTQILGWVGLIGALAAAGCFILSSIFYMAYVCKARKTEKKIDSVREAALAKIESLLGGNK